MLAFPALARFPDEVASCSTEISIVCEPGNVFSEFFEWGNDVILFVVAYASTVSFFCSYRLLLFNFWRGPHYPSYVLLHAQSLQL